MTLRIHEHGGEVYAIANQLHLAVDDLLDFSSNANLFAEPLTQKLVDKTPYPFLHYPDSKAHKLLLSIAEHEHVHPDQIMPGNGSTDIIWHTLLNLAPQKVLLIGPLFNEYAHACRSLNIPFDVLVTEETNEFNVSIEQHQELWNTDADLVIICTPNNPGCITYSPIHSILGMIRAPRILIDNTYQEFLFGTLEYDQNQFNAYSRILRQGVTLFTLHSFTKFFCCPGIRLGYLIGERRHIANLQSRRPSWMVSPHAQLMGRTFLANIDAYREALPALRQAVIHTAQELRRSPLFDSDFVFEGPGFVTAKVATPWSNDLVYTHLLEAKIVVRHCGNITGMPAGYIRMQARSPEDLQKLMDSLESLVHHFAS